MVYKAIATLANKKDSTILKKMLIDVGQVLLKNPLKPIVLTITQCLCEDEQILKGITVPVTILWAKDDELLPISYMKRLQSLVPSARIQYIEGHHNWCLVDQKYVLIITSSSFTFLISRSKVILRWVLTVFFQA